MAKLPFPNNVIEDHTYFLDKQFTRPAKEGLMGGVDLHYMLKYFLTDPNIYYYVQEGVSVSTAFDFSTVSLAKEDIQTNFDFAVRLLKDDLFTLPFDDCLFILSNSEAVLMCQDRGAAVGNFLDGLIITPCIYCPVVKGAEQRLLIPLGSFTNLSSLWSFIETKTFPTAAEQIKVKFAQYLTRNGVELAFMKDVEFYQEATMEMVKCALACNQLLMSPHVKTEHTPAPVKLNKARTAKGKPVIGNRYKITLRDFKAERDPVSRMVGGSHASPIPHWRRGHIRRLDDNRIIPVMPTIVGAKGVQSDIGRKMYEYARRKE